MVGLNFSWLIEQEVAGHSAPTSEDDLNYLKSKGIKSLVRMAESHKVQVTPTQVGKAGLKDYHVPITDFTAPTQDQIVRILDFTSKSIVRGEPVGISCGAGYGRTGTILACYLVKQVCTRRAGNSGSSHQEARLY